MKRTALRRMLGTAGLAAILQMLSGHAQSVNSPAVSNPAAPFAVAPDQPGGLLHQIAAELRALRTEVLHLRLDAQELRVHRLEQEIRQVRQKQVELRAEEEQHRQQVAEASELAGQQLDPEQRSQLDAFRAELVTGGGDRLRAERAEAARIESELTRRLEREKAQYAQLQAQLTKLLPGATGQ